MRSLNSTRFDRRLAPLLVICIAAVLLPAFSSAAADPPGNWNITPPEEQGLRSDLLADMMAHIQAQSYHIESVSVVRNGRMVLDAYFWPFPRGYKHNVYSCTKSILSALIGIAIDKGYIQHVDQPIKDFFPPELFAGLDAAKKDITLEHLLVMASGLQCRDSYRYGWRGLFEMRSSPDWAQYVLNLPMAATPGDTFVYCNGVSYLLYEAEQIGRSLTIK